MIYLIIGSVFLVMRVVDILNFASFCQTSRKTRKIIIILYPAAQAKKTSDSFLPEMNRAKRIQRFSLSNV